MSDPTVTLYVRVPPSERDALDAWLADYARRMAPARITRNDAVRLLLRAGIRATAGDTPAGTGRIVVSVNGRIVTMTERD